jgi:hypothetical protein
MQPRLYAHSVVSSRGTALLAARHAHAELAPQLRSMLDAAIASGNDADIDTIAKYLKQASPADAAEIDRTIGDHRAQIAAAKEEKLRHLGLLEGWKGEGQIGATQSSGNATTVGLTAGLGLTRESAGASACARWPITSATMGRPAATRCCSRSNRTTASNACSPMAWRSTSATASPASPRAPRFPAASAIA